MLHLLSKATIYDPLLVKYRKQAIKKVKSFNFLNRHKTHTHVLEDSGATECETSMGIQ